MIHKMCNALLNALDRLTVTSIICQIPPYNSIVEKTKKVTFVHFHWGNAILPCKALIHPRILFRFFSIVFTNLAQMSTIIIELKCGHFRDYSCRPYTCSLTLLQITTRKGKEHGQKINSKTELKW